MRRVRYYEYGGPDVLTIEEAEVPVPGPGEVLLRTEAIGANFVDTRMRRGPAAGPLFRRALPGSLTGDVVGTVETTGPGVDQGLIGRRVAALSEDAFAEHVVTDARWLAPVPDEVDLGMASMLPMGAPVALRALRTGRLAEGETVLVHSAAGGIGHLALQLARLLGAGKVIAAVGSPAKFDFVRSHGADAVVDYAADDWPERVREAAPGGVDLVLDSVGGQILRQSLDLLAPFGRAVVYGVAGAELLDVPVTSLFALKSVAGFSLLAWRAAAPEQARAEMTELAGHAAAGRLRTAVHARLPLADPPAVHRLIEERTHLGRILVLP
ncbi:MULTISPECIES: zinc-binding dehydrogenase [unclassified Streptomyces]|uniref:quinone oxidoreductase family protein n=1 Tax=unclassified Streptomyces TaxID=2593676 RepID=UPI00037BD9B2|nr:MULTISPECIES: zinc-binding dehydrogenase [unclassified Streptomyces]MYT31191.1 zinc-binding dehydrogenase [Streptomyces sp. SID8354]